MSISTDSPRNLLDEHLIQLRKVATTLPDRVHCATPQRWADRGLVRGNQVIRLESIAIGGRRYTSSEALARFFGRLSSPVPDDQVSSDSRFDRQRAQAAQQADAIFGR